MLNTSNCIPYNPLLDANNIVWTLKNIKWGIKDFVNIWPALPKPATYAHHVKEQFSSSMDSSINKLTKCQYTTAKCWQVCFCWGLFLRPVRHPQVLGCPLNATGCLVQATTLLEITTWLVNDIGHGFSYVLWQFECSGGHFTMKNAELSCNLPLHISPPPPTLHPYISACGVDKKLSKMAGNSVS